MTNYNWNYPTTVWVGKDRAKDLEKACVEIKTLKPLLVTDKDNQFRIYKRFSK